MSGGMAEIIRLELRKGGYQMPGDTQPYETQAANIADALVKAGYGSLQEFQPEYGAREMLFGGLSKEPHAHGPVRDPRWMDKSTHVRLIGPWVELVDGVVPDGAGS